MKNLVIILLLITVSYTGLSQSSFDKFEDRKGVTSIVMNQKMFKLLSKIDLNSSDPEMQSYINMVNSLNNVNMYTTTEDGVAAEMDTEMKNYLRSANLEELLRAKDDGKNVKFYYKPGKNDDFVSEFVMFLKGDIDGEDRTVFFQLTGDIDLKEVSKLAQEFNFQGSDTLEEVKNAKKG